MPIKLVGADNEFVKGGTQKDRYTDDEVVAVDCPLCRGREGRLLYKEHGAIGIRQCGECGLIYTSPRLKSPEQVYWGDADTYYSEGRLIFEGKAKHHREPNYKAELRAIERHKAPSRILDVGCNMGVLLRISQDRGWQPVGLEPSPALASLAGRHGFPVHNCFLNELAAQHEGTFDVVALSDVFEHITEPRSFLAEARRLLKADGILYVKVPNARWSVLKQRLLGLAGQRPEQGLWDSYEHVVHYTDKTLRRMLEQAGFATREFGIDPPVQTPNWHELVGHYYQYPTPWPIDWKRKFVRAAFYWMSWVERVLRGGSIGYCAPNIFAIAAIAAPDGKARIS
jgi:SAM-dependent methyltransferase